MARRCMRLVHSGWGAALEDVHERVRWRAGLVEVRNRSQDDVHLDGRGLVFGPSVFLRSGPATYTEPPWQPAVVYVARGSAALWDPPPTTPPACDETVPNDLGPGPGGRAAAHPGSHVGTTRRR